MVQMLASKLCLLNALLLALTAGRGDPAHQLLPAMSHCWSLNSTALNSLITTRIFNSC
jgi:hypothetical protein